MDISSAKTLNKVKKALKARKRSNVNLKLGRLSFDRLLCLAQENIDCFQYEEGELYCQEALRRDPDNIAAMELLAALFLETGDIDAAKHYYGRAITLNPDDGYSKYLSMGQLLGSKDGLQCYFKGIEIMKSNLEIEKNNQSSLYSVSKCNNEINKKNFQAAGNSCSSDNQNCLSNVDSDINSLKRKISDAYGAIAELYMTDLCDEETAEAECTNFIQLAIDEDPENFDAYQLMASFCLLKEDFEAARNSIDKSLSLWFSKYKDDSSGKSEAHTIDPVEICSVSFSSRISAAKILIELDDHEKALDILDGLSSEDDEDVTVWYLMGWSCCLQGEKEKDNARKYFHKALKVHKITPCDDDQMIAHLNELLEDLDTNDLDEISDDESFDEMEELNDIEMNTG